jgi:hypothetical protein
MLAGAAVLIALAIGLLNGGADAAPVSSSGYGDGGPTYPPGTRFCTVGEGYNARPCDGKVSDLSNKPRKPVKGKGFVVKFKSSSGGTYRVFAKKDKKTYELAEGVSGIATVETGKVGKKLRAGRYALSVKVTNNEKSDTASKKLTIRKRR